MAIIETQELCVEPVLDADDARADRKPAGAATEPARPGCVFTAALRHRVERGEGIALPPPPHIATFDSEACQRFWTEWAERVRAAVAAQRDR